MDRRTYYIRNYGMLNGKLISRILFKVRVRISGYVDSLFFERVKHNIKPLFNQVESRKPINNPVAGRCY